MRSIRATGGGAGVCGGDVRRRENSGGRLGPVNNPRVSTTLGQTDWRASSDQCLRRGKDRGREGAAKEMKEGLAKGVEGGSAAAVVLRWRWERSVS
ncbi:hypothetical protein AOQ84DRAFT_141930 [Glonium stellatum]|uniref:Uncharacterized protein n=1 Tax=Glonium stellatum TaxID=574774 RepID=A0A8E2ESP1_9PEZI|nr:hypothetical protein AOQ84DRAFT_141930 [Glonium stellatum]